MIKLVDSILNRITMYRLVLYLLIILVVAGYVLSFVGLVQASPISIVISLILALVICLATNEVFSKTFEAPTNVESVYITALILVLILPPVKSLSDVITIGWASILAMASKYILAINRRHIFNPAAIAVVITSLAFGGSANWWVGNALMTPLVILSGLLISRKMRRQTLYFTFIGTVLGIGSIWEIVLQRSVFTFISQLFLHSSLFFLAGIMLTEPLTMPPTKDTQVLYSILTGYLFLPQVHFGAYYPSPEAALVLGNLYSYIISPKVKLWLHVNEKIKTSANTYDFVFPKNTKMNYLPGQYMEWTLAHQNPDSRGNRRYFTLASSPTEDTIRLGVKFYEPSSSFKKSLLSADDKTPVIASQLAGNFTLPDNPKTKLAFIAGGIGITPFRSMIKYLLDKNQPRDIVLFYFNKSEDEIVYKDIFDQAKSDLDINTFYFLPKGESSGRISAEIVTTTLPDYKDRTFYVSGPNSMVEASDEILTTLGISRSKIIKDYFPGFV